MTGRAPISVFVFCLLASVAQAQFNRENIELNCYGGRNQMGLHVCACDQGWISGSAALILGNSVQLYGPGTLANCLAWADDLNGAGSADVPVTPPTTPSQPPKPPALGSKAGVSPPSTGLTPPPATPPENPPTTPPTTPPKREVTIPPIEESDDCAVGLNACLRSQTAQDACVKQFNACNDERIRREREAAFLEDYIKNDPWFGDWRLNSELPSLDALTTAMFSGVRIHITVDCSALVAAGVLEKPVCDTQITARWISIPDRTDGGYWENCYNRDKCGQLVVYRVNGPGTPRVVGPYVTLYRGVIVELTPDGRVLTKKVNQSFIKDYVGGREIGNFALNSAEEVPDRVEPPAAKDDCPPGSTDMFCVITGPGAAISNGKP